MLREAGGWGYRDRAGSAKEIMARGELVSDRRDHWLVRERLSRQERRGGFVLDGFRGP